MPRNRQIPPQRIARNARNSDSKKTYSDCYSITIRTGKGVNLGSNSFSKVLEYLYEISQYHVLSLEMDDEKRHLQGGIFTHVPLRQDKIREKILPYVLSMYKESMEDQGSVVTFLGLEQVKKNALCIKPHNNWEILVKYCLKSPSYFIGHRSPVNLIDIGFACKHEDDKQNCKYYFYYGECLGDATKKRYEEMNISGNIYR